MVRKVISKIISILSIAIIVFAAFVLLTVVFTKQGQVPKIFGYSIMRVLTGSMTPQIPVDCMVLVKSTDPKDVELGDVISFYSTDEETYGSVITHRVVEIEVLDGKTFFTTKGDANIIQDENQVQEENLIGCVVWQSIFIGKLLRLMSNPLIFVPVILIPLLAILASNVISAAKAAKTIGEIKEEEKQEAAELADKKRKKEELEGMSAEFGDILTNILNEQKSQVSDGIKRDSMIKDIIRYRKGRLL